MTGRNEPALFLGESLIATRKINVRNAMQSISIKSDNIDDITEEIYAHASAKLGIREAAHGKKLHTRDLNTIRAIKHSAIKANRLINKQKSKPQSKAPDIPHIVHIKNYISVINKIVNKSFKNRRVGNVEFPPLSITYSREFIQITNLAHKHIAHTAKTEQIRKAIARRNDNFINNPKLFFRKIVTGKMAKEHGSQMRMAPHTQTQTINNKF